MIVRRCCLTSVSLAICAALAAVLPAAAGCHSTQGHPDAPEITVVDGEADRYFNELLQPLSRVGALLCTATVEQLQAQLDEQVALLSTYRLEYGDSFTITVLDHPAWSSDVTVLRDGNVYFGFLPQPLSVVGRTLGEVREGVMEALEPYFDGPLVKIENVQLAPTSSTVKVIGAVNKPGRVRILPGFRLLDAISDAEGVRTFVDRFGSAFSQNTERIPSIDWRRATVQREARYVPADTRPPGARDTDLCVLEVDFLELLGGSAEHNVPLFPNDVIHIPQFEPVNNRVVVAGMVRSPGVQYYRESLSLVEALARSGWMIEENAAYSGVYLVRGSRDPSGEHRAYRLNAINVVKGRARDIMLQDGDIVYVDSDTLHDVNTVVSKIMPLFSFAQAMPNTYSTYRDFDFVR